MRGWLIAMVGATAVGVWLIAVTLLTPLHSVVFLVVPPDGLISDRDRSTIDGTVTRFLLGGPSTADLSGAEWSHLQDVRSRIALLGGVVLVCLLVSLIYQPSHRELGLASVGVLALSIGSLIFFQSFFVAFHQVVFPAGNWELPSSDFFLTRIYPFNFFIVVWCGVTIGAATTLWLGRFLFRSARGAGTLHL